MRADRLASLPLNVQTKLTEFWEKAPESIRMFDILMENTPSACMDITEEQQKLMFARSKCFTVLPPGDIYVGPSDGFSYCFIQPCMTGIPTITQKILWLLSEMEGQLDDYTKVSLPTTEMGVQKDRNHQNNVVGLHTFAERSRTTRSNRRTRDGYIDLANIINDRELDQGPEVKVPVRAFKVHVGFTGAEFTVGEEKKREAFCVVMVTPASNFAFWAYFHEKFLCKPKQSDKSYKELLSIYEHRLQAFTEVMNSEIYENLRLREGEHGRYEDYLYNPGGQLGNLTVLNPLMLPFKVWTRVRAMHPSAVDMHILGWPEMNFRQDSERVHAWADYLHKNIRHNAQLESAFMEALSEYWQPKSKDKDKDKERANDSPDRETCFDTGCVGGWPLGIASDGTVTRFGLPPFPLMLEYHFKAKGHFSSWLANLQGPNGIPEFVQAKLRTFLSCVCPIDESPDVQHFMSDKSVATPALVQQKYHR